MNSIFTNAPLSQQEDFELILNTDVSAISIQELISFLDNTEILVNSINKTLNSKYGIGYDDINVDVLALERGSFKIRFNFKKLTSNPTFVAICSSVLTPLMYNLLSNDPAPQSIQCVNNVVVNITNADLLENKKTIRSVGEIAKTAVESDNIRDLSLVYEKTDGELERVNISKEILSQIIRSVEDSNDKLVTNHEKVRLEIVSPVFLSTPTTWKVKLNNRTFTAKMSDNDFLEEMNTKKIAFAKGDIIVADLESVTEETESGHHTKNTIKKVHNYPKYTKIIKNKEPLLFDNLNK